MAIVIPSKHIYDKDNNKIRDNKIDRIEVNATEITPDNEYETSVYNEQFLDLMLQSEEKENEDLKAVFTGITGEFLCSYVGCNSQKYNEVKIYIPKIKNNSYIKKLLLGLNDNGEQNIKTVFIGTKKEGVSRSIFHSYIQSNELVVTKGNIQYDYEQNQPSITLNERYYIPNTIHYTYNSNAPTATIKTINFGNLSTVSFKEEIINNIEYYTLNLKIFCGMKIVYMGGLGNYNKNNGDFIVDGTYEEYTPTSIEITVYGNTIGIDLTDKTVYIPDESGDKPFSIEGNELMQTSNYYTLKQVDDKDLISPTSYWVGKSDYNNYAYYTSVHIDGEKNSWETYVDYKDTKDGVIKTVIIPPRQNTHSPALETIGADTIEIIKVYNKNSICSQFQDTLLEYSNGKETATILCDIYNYVDAVKFKVLEYELLEDGSVYCRLKTDNINDIYDISNIGYIYVNGVEGFVQDVDEEEFLLIVYFNDESIIEYLQKNEITINNNSNFYFNIGDVVIPMVYGANGVDKPMSKYKDGTHKKFKVLGNRIFYDGAVWQELTLQEK